MDYVITSDQPFDQIESQAIEALEHQGFRVQRTFSLRSAARATEDSGGSPGYSVLLLHAAGPQRQPMGSLHLLEQGERFVLRPDLTVADGADTYAAAIAALVSAGLNICVEASRLETCTELGQAIGRQPQELDSALRD
jgi:hypothetical protein